MKIKNSFGFIRSTLLCGLVFFAAVPVLAGDVDSKQADGAVQTIDGQFQQTSFNSAPASTMRVSNSSLGGPQPAFFDGALTEDSPTFNNPDGQAAGNQHYCVQEFTVDAAGAYTIEKSSPNTTGSPSDALDTFLRLYATAFDPNDPVGAIASNDDFSGTLIVLPGPYAGIITSTATGFQNAQPSSRLPGVNLTDGTQYFLVHTAWPSSGNTQTGTAGQPVGQFYTGIGGPGTITLGTSNCSGGGPEIDVSPASFLFSVDEGDTDSDTLTIDNIGVGTLTWDIELEDATASISGRGLPVPCDNPGLVSWLSVDPMSGTTDPGTPSLIDVLIDTDGLVAGTYNANLCVNSDDSAGNELVVVPVELTVNPLFTIGGSVTGLAGTGLMLQNNGGDDLGIPADGPFTFPTAVSDTENYDVTVATQPADPSQSCSVTNGSGTVSNADVTDVVVDCVTDQFTVGGTVSGLIGDQVVLQNNGGDDQVVTADGAFTFTAQDDGTAYNVTVLTHPAGPSQTCSVTDGTGSLASSNVTNVVVNCGTDQFTVGGTVSGLTGDQVVLQNNGGDDQVITADGAFAFTAQNDGTAYNVTVLTQPSGPIQTCSVSNGSGMLAGSSVSDIEITCVSEPPVVGLSTTALHFGIVQLGDSASETVTITNTGTGDLIISGISDPDSPFAITGGSCLLLPMTLLPTESCEIEVTYTPTNQGATFNSEIMIDSNAASSPDTITVRGTGEPLGVPALGRLGLALLILMLAGLAWRATHLRRLENA